MMRLRKVATTIRDDHDNYNYINELHRAIDAVNVAIDNISYGDLRDEDTYKKINKDVRDELSEIIYRLEDIIDVPVRKPKSKGSDIQ